MLRTLWVGINLVLATLVFGLGVLLPALVRYRGGWYARATQEWARAVLWAGAIPVRLEGAERVRWGEPLVLASNHVSGWDIFALAGTLPRPFSFIGKAELNRIPFFGHVWRAAGHISVDRSNRVRAIQSLNQAGAKIRAEKSTVVIFPEGTRSRTGELRPFKKGAFMLALQARAPIVPAVVLGSTRIMPGGSLRLRRHPITVRLGEPIPTAGLRVADVEQLMERVRERMLAMQREEVGSALHASR